MNSAVFEARSVHFTYADGTKAVRGVSITLEPSQAYCLLGANGAGKTTLMHCCLGLLIPDRGECLIDGINVAKSPDKARSLVGFLPDRVALYEYLTPVENIELFVGLSGAVVPSRKQVRDMLGSLGLSKLSHTKDSRELSKGMRQKVALAACLLKKAKILFLDEPTAGLDPKSAHDLLDLLVKQKSEGIAVFLATHDVFRARSVSDKLGIMREGQLIQDLDKKEIANRDLETLYLDSMERK